MYTGALGVAKITRKKQMGILSGIALGLVLGVVMSSWFALTVCCVGGFVLELILKVVNGRGNAMAEVGETIGEISETIGEIVESIGDLSGD